MVSAGQSGAVEAKRRTCGPSSAYCRDWLPDLDECENFLEIILFSLPSPPVNTERAFPRKPKSSLESVIEQAFEFQERLEDGVVNTRAEIAERYGISRARVTQVLNILRLPQAVLSLLVELAEQGRTPCSERRLRSIAKLPTENAQMAAVKRICGATSRGR